MDSGNFGKIKVDIKQSKLVYRLELVLVPVLC